MSVEEFSQPPVEMKIFKPFDEVEMLLIKKRNQQKMRYIQLNRWKEEFDGRNVLVEHLVRTDYKLKEAKTQFASLNELLKTFYKDMEKLKEAMLQQRKRDQREFAKRLADLLNYKEIVTWLQKPKIRRALYDKANGIRELNKEEGALLNLVREIIDPQLPWHIYEEVWKHLLRDFARLRTELISDEDETIRKLIDFKFQSKETLGMQ